MSEDTEHALEPGVRTELADQLTYGRYLAPLSALPYRLEQALLPDRLGLDLAVVYERNR